MPCNPLKVNRRFGGTCLYLQGKRIPVSQAKERDCSWQAELFYTVSCFAWFLFHIHFYQCPFFRYLR
jgi:hypothetical protein